MADPLSLLRQFNMQRKMIVEKDDHVIFGEFSLPKTAKTNYMEWGTGTDGTPKDYYTIECLMYLLKNLTMQHPVYVRQAASQDIHTVKRPDRKDLLAYLKGETSTSVSIDKSAALEMPTQVKRTAEDSLESSQKKPKLDQRVSQKLKDQLALKDGATNREAGAQVSGIECKRVIDCKIKGCIEMAENFFCMNHLKHPQTKCLQIKRDVSINPTDFTGGKKCNLQCTLSAALMLVSPTDIKRNRSHGYHIKKEIQDSVKGILSLRNTFNI